MKEKLLKRFDKWVSPLLFGILSANAAWAFTQGNAGTIVFCTFVWGWSLVTMIRTLIIEYDIMLLDRDTRRIEREIEWTRRRMNALREVTDVRQRQPLHMHEVWKTGPLH